MALSISLLSDGQNIYADTLRREIKLRAYVRIYNPSTTESYAYIIAYIKDANNKLHMSGYIRTLVRPEQQKQLSLIGSYVVLTGSNLSYDTGCTYYIKRYESTNGAISPSSIMSGNNGTIMRSGSLISTRLSTSTVSYKVLNTTISTMTMKEGVNYTTPSASSYPGLTGWYMSNNFRGTRYIPGATIRAPYSISSEYDIYGLISTMDAVYDATNSTNEVSFGFIGSDTYNNYLVSHIPIVATQNLYFEPDVDTAQLTQLINDFGWNIYADNDGTVLS